MLSKQIRKTLSITLAVCFISAIYALPVLAMPQNDDPDQINPPKTKQSENKNHQNPPAANAHRTPAGPPIRQNNSSPRQKQPSNNAHQHQTAMQDSQPRPNAQPSNNQQRPASMAPNEHKDMNKPNHSSQDVRGPGSIYKPDMRHPDNNRPDDRNRHIGPNHGPVPNPRYEKHRSYPHWRRSNIVFRFGGPRNHFWWGCERGISLGEYLILMMIVQARPNVTVEEVFNLHQNGYSYETICYDYDLDWVSINHGARLKYRNMNVYSMEHGIPFWRWNDKLEY